MKFYLGTHSTHWLRSASYPLFVSRRRLARLRTVPTAACDWALDSGGFTELNLFGEWRTTESEYLDDLARYHTAGRLEWAAPQDWMCEDVVLEATGGSVAEHQERTVASVLSLRAARPPVHVIPVLQGQTVDDYLACADLYAAAGLDLTLEPTVGVGSVCRRQSSDEIERIVSILAGEGYRLHGFGVKFGGLARYAHLLASADSLAWSYNARRHPPLDGCGHQSCSSCPRWATAWRTRLLASLDAPVQTTLAL